MRYFAIMLTLVLSANTAVASSFSIGPDGINSKVTGLDWLDEAMYMKTLCQPDAEGICTQCKTVVPPRLHRTCPAKHPGVGEQPRSTHTGVGDLTAEFFATFGITEDRYREVKAALHLKSTCGCSARKQWLSSKP